MTASRDSEAIAALFGRVASDYNRTGPRFFDHLAERLVAHADVQPGARVLDLATGTGAVLAEGGRTAASGSLAGVDIATPMIEEASRRLRALGYTDLDLRVGSAERLDFPTDAFDVALCSSAFDLFSDQRAVLAECRRILLTAGTLAVAVFGDEGWGWRAELRERFVPSSEPAPGNFSAGELERVIGAGGFRGVRVERERLDVVFAGAEEWWACQWSHGERATLERTPSSALDAYRADAAVELERLREDDGSIHWRPEVLIAVAQAP